MLVGMAAAVVQGVPGSTLDTDFWIDLPKRQYMRVINRAIRLGAQALSPNVVEFPDGSRIDFLYSVGGLRSFTSEYARAHHCEWLGLTIAVLPLERIYHSKSVIARPKDLLHMELIRTRLRGLEELSASSVAKRPKERPSRRRKRLDRSHRQS